MAENYVTKDRLSEMLQKGNTVEVCANCKYFQWSNDPLDQCGAGNCLLQPEDDNFVFHFEFCDRYEKKPVSLKERLETALCNQEKKVSADNLDEVKKVCEQMIANIEKETESELMKKNYQFIITMERKDDN